MGSVLPAVGKHASLAVAALRKEEVIAVPTDTLYGLAADACCAAAIQKIYTIKGRSTTSPLAICVADVTDVKKVAATEHLPHGLLDELLPGPVTLVLPKGGSSLLDASLNPGLVNIGIRVPDSDFIREIARAFGGPLALTSANISNTRSSTSIDEFSELWPKISVIFDGGVLPKGRAGSTIVDLTQADVYKILRPGSALELANSVLEEGYGLKDITNSS